MSKSSRQAHRTIAILVALLASATQRGPAQDEQSAGADARLKTTMAAFYVAIAQANRRGPLGLPAIAYYEPGAVIACEFLDAPESYHRDRLDEALSRRANGAYLIIGDSYRPESLAVMDRYAVDVEVNTVNQRPAKLPNFSGTEYQLRTTVLWHQEDDGDWRVVFQRYAPKTQ